MDYLNEFVTVFVDDLLIYSENKLDHEMHVKKILEWLQIADLQASIKKCKFHVTCTKYLSFILITEGIEVDSEKIAIVRNWMILITVQSIQSFLNFCNFYQQFIRNYSHIVKQLNHLIWSDVVFV